MPTTKKYLLDASLMGIAEITGTGRDDERRCWVRLNRTWLHAQGGGQKADRGTIDDVEVFHVSHAENGEVNHYVTSLAAFQTGQSVLVRVEPEWRNLSSRYHTAGHATALLVEARFPHMKAVAGHHWPGEARVEFLGDPKPDLLEVQTQLIEDLRNAIEADEPICIVGDPVISRAIQIGNRAPTPCGGTHVKSLGELGFVGISRIRIKSGRLRISYEISQ